MRRCLRSPRTRTILRNLFPISRWLPSYTLGTLQCDVIAGVTIGMMVVPQALAYASVAGFKQNAEYGLYASFIGPFMYILMGSAKDVTLGPTAIMSLLLSAVAGDAQGNTSLADAVALSFMSGIIQLILGVLRLGFLVEFISFPVISGFTSSAAITIIVSELKHILGLEGHGIRESFIYCLYDTFKFVPDFKIWDMALGLVCILVLLLMQEMNKFYGAGPTRLAKAVWLTSTARNAILVVVTGLIAYIAYAAGNPDALTTIQPLPKGLPGISAPDISLDRIKRLIGPAFTIALIGFLENIAIAKAFARQNGYEVDASQELIAIGSCNFFSSFFSAYPVTGSFSRTAVNSASGVKTTLSGLFTGLIVIFSLLFLTDMFHYIPQAALGAIIICAVIPMIEFKLVMKIWRFNRWDIVPYSISFFGCLFLDIQYGIAIAMGVSLLFLLFHVARPDHRLLGFDSRASTYISHEVEDDRVDDSNDIVVFRFGGSLLYPAMASTKETILELVGQKRCKAIVLDFTCCTRMDYTGCQVLRELTHDLENRGVKIYASYVPPSIAEMLGRGMLLSAITVCSNTGLAVAAAKEASRDYDSDDSQALTSQKDTSIQARWTYGAVEPATL